MPGDEVWLVGERRSTGEQKYYVSNSPADATLKMLAAAIKASGLILTFESRLRSGPTSNVKIIKSTRNI